MMRDLKTTIGGAIKKRRELLGITQAELADQAGIAPSMISQIEGGQRIPSVPVLVKLACALKINIDFLVGLSGPKDFAEARDPSIRAALKKLNTLPADDKQRFLRLLNAFVAKGRPR